MIQGVQTATTLKFSEQQNRKAADMKTENIEAMISHQMSQRLFGEKLVHYAQRKPKQFLQLDGFYLPDGGDDVMRPDEDGDCLGAQPTVELMYGAAVRVLIPYDTDPLVAARQLKKLAKWLKKSPDLMEFAKPWATATVGANLDDIPF